MQIAMDRAQFTRSLQDVSTQTGEQLTSDSGEISHSGVKVHYEFNGTVLTILVKEKPFFLSEGYLENQIHAWFASQ